MLLIQNIHMCTHSCHTQMIDTSTVNKIVYTFEHLSRLTVIQNIQCLCKESLKEAIIFNSEMRKTSQEINLSILEQ